MAPAAFIQHQLPRRLRLKLPSRRGDQLYFKDLVGRLANVPGVAALNANPLTGSLLIRHDGNADAIMSFMEREGLVQLRHEPETPAEGDAATTIPDPNKGLAVGLSGLSLVQMVRGQLTGSASENFWNAYRAHAHLSNPWAAALLFGLGVYQLVKGEVLNSATALMFYALTAQQLSREEALLHKRPSL